MAFSALVLVQRFVAAVVVVAVLKEQLTKSRWKGAAVGSDQTARTSERVRRVKHQKPKAAVAAERVQRREGTRAAAMAIRGAKGKRPWARR